MPDRIYTSRYQEIGWREPNGAVHIDQDENYQGYVFAGGKSTPLGYVQNGSFTPRDQLGTSGTLDNAASAAILAIAIGITFVLSAGIVFGFDMMREGITNKETKKGTYGVLIVIAVTFLPTLFFGDWGQLFSFFGWLMAITYLFLRWFLSQSKFVIGTIIMWAAILCLVLYVGFLIYDTYIAR
jgi:hypothetical protein